MKLGSLLFVCTVSSCIIWTHGLGPILDSPRGYRYIEGIAIEECPEGTHAYMSNIMGPTWSQKTCAEPISRDLGGICGMSRCDCDEPKVLDESTGNCVNLEDCPDTTRRCQFTSSE